MSAKKPHPMDVHAGSRLRLRRMVIGMSQEKLAERMGISFQQIQKYEKGTNRIGASRLWQLARILDVPVQFFFDDASIDVEPPIDSIGGSNAVATALIDFLQSRDGLQLNQAFVRISDPKVRKKLVELAQTLADDEPPEEEYN